MIKKWYIQLDYDHLKDGVDIYSTSNRLNNKEKDIINDNINNTITNDNFKDEEVVINNVDNNIYLLLLLLNSDLLKNII